MRRLYKMYREENGAPIVDLIIKKVDNKFDVEEKVNDIHIKDITSDELNMKLNELKINEDLKLEIKKGILEKHIGLYERNRDLLEDKFLLGKNDIVATKDKMNESFEEFEAKMKKDFKDIEDKIRDFFK